MRFFTHTFQDMGNTEVTRILYDDGTFVWTIHEESRFWSDYEMWLSEGNEPEEWNPQIDQSQEAN